MSANIDWKAILALLVQAAVPIIIKMMPEIIKSILDWLRGASDEEVIAVGRRAGLFFNAAKIEIA